MVTYKDLKSVAYIDKIIPYVESLFKIRFKPYGDNKYTAYCPFHVDTKDSFRVYVNDKKEVRFHCFGACNTEWDVYNLIRLRKRCSFAEAQIELAKTLGVKNFEMFLGKVSQEPQQEDESEDPEVLMEPEVLAPEIMEALDRAAEFYKDLLLSDGKQFEAIRRYLYRRGVNENMIQDFKIGYCPPFKDEKYAGRALMNNKIDHFMSDYLIFNRFYMAGLFRLLNDETVPGFGFYRQQIDFTKKDPFSRNYADFFAGRITFPVYDSRGLIKGFMGRRPDNRGTKWIKQQQMGSLNTKDWLYGIDKAARWIEHYKTVILVEGIFDYFGFLRLFQDPNKPIIVSTLGTSLSDEAEIILGLLGVENFIVAYDWDLSGKKAIIKMADKIGYDVFYLGGIEVNQDPADKLKGVVNCIDGFSLRHLLEGAKKIQSKSDKPISFSFLPAAAPGADRVCFMPGMVLKNEITLEHVSEKKYGKLYYDAGAFLQLLTYDHGNKVALYAKLQTLHKMLEHGSPKKGDGRQLMIYGQFIYKKIYLDLGPALIFWLKIALEQQYRRRKVQVTDSTLTEWLHTSRTWVIK